MLFTRPIAAHRALAVCAIGALLVLPAISQTPTKKISIKFTQVLVSERDDPVSNDEPYLINIGFRGRLIDRGNGTVGFSSLIVNTVGSGPHNNLGRSHDNWAAKSTTWYTIDTSPTVGALEHKGLQAFTIQVPLNDPGWVIGSIAILMEEDAFVPSTATAMRTKIRDEVDAGLRSLSMSNVNINSITDTVVKKIAHDIVTSMQRLNYGGIIRGYASMADPDDFGGINVVMAITDFSNGLVYYSGQPFSSVTNLPVQYLPNGVRTANFEVSYPIGDLSSIPVTARYKGRLRLRGILLHD
jgi:hypothetical protein